MLHHVGISRIISSNQEMDYDMTNKSNHLDWFNKGPWYNKNICSKWHGIKFEDFITQARTYRYNTMCYLVAHDRLQTYYKDGESSIDDRAIPNVATVKELKSLGATFILLTYGSNCFVQIIVLGVSHIALLRKRCSNRYIKMLKE